MSNINLSNFKRSSLFLVVFSVLMTFLVMLNGCNGGGGKVNSNSNDLALLHVTPKDQLTGVNLQPVVTLTFNMPMLPSSLSAQNIKIREAKADAENFVLTVQSISDDSKSVTYTLDKPLQSDKKYQIIVDATKICSMDGIKLGNSTDQIVSTFITGKENYPQVVRVYPTNGMKNVSLNPHIIVAFNKKMKVSTLNATNIKIQDRATREDFPFQVQSVRPNNQIVVLVTTQPLRENGTYDIIFNSQNIMDEDGHTLKDSFNSVFYTGSSHTPTISSVAPFNGEENLSRVTDVAVSFSQAMDPKTLNNSNITLRKVYGGNLVPLDLHSVTPDDSTVIFTVKSLAGLEPHTPYLIKVAKNIKALNHGVTLEKDQYFAFITGNKASPVVATTDPANGEENVKPTTEITIYFSTAMKKETIIPENVILQLVDGSKTKDFELKLKSINGSGNLAVFELKSDTSLPTGSLFNLVVAPNKIQSQSGEFMDASKDKEVIAQFHT